MIWKRIVLSPYNYTWYCLMGYPILLTPQDNWSTSKVRRKQINKAFFGSMSQRKIRLIVLKSYDSQIIRPMEYNSNVRHDRKDKEFSVLYS